MARAAHGGGAPAPAGSRAFEALVRADAQTEGRSGLVILVDEIQSADPEGLRTLAYAWQHLQAEGEDVPAAVMLFLADDLIAAAVQLRAVSGMALVQRHSAHGPRPGAVRVERGRCRAMAAVGRGGLVLSAAVKGRSGRSP